VARSVVVAFAILALAAGGSAAGERSGRIAFVRYVGPHQELFTVAPDGTGLRRLTRNRVEDYDPKWSPEGRRLMSFGSTGIVVRDLKGTVLRRLPRTCCQVGDWSPDGRLIAHLEFACDDPSGKGGPACANLWIVRSGGSGRRRLVKEGLDATGGFDRLYAWAPGARRLVYTASTKALVIVDVATGGKRTLRGTRFGEHPAWSPDGRRIAFLRQKAPFGGSDIYVVAPDGSGLRPLVRSRSHLEAPTWSPDGRHLAYFRLVAGTPGDERYAVMVAVTSTTEWLDWSPDSTGVLWTSFNRIFVARADGSTPARLVATGDAPDWG